MAKTFIVEVSVHGGIWIGECDALGLVTEAESFEELVNRAMAVTPELAEMNGLGKEMIHLEFHYRAPLEAVG